MTNCKKVMNYQYSESDGMNESFETRPALPVILVLAWHKKASERWPQKQSKLFKSQLMRMGLDCRSKSKCRHGPELSDV